MLDDVIARELARLKVFEGVIDHLYLDTRGHVTVGIGFMLPHVADALRLDFKLRTAAAQSPPTASASEVASGYATIAKMEPGHLASFYRAASSLYLIQADIDLAAKTDLRSVVVQVNAALPSFGLYPESCQEALLDMAYNLGALGLMRFRTMLAAIQNGDWAAAAAQCARRGVDDERNRETAALLRLSAIKPSSGTITAGTLPVSGASAV
jgi:GH24 family phage-related lysozyme (muramidase)